MPLIDFGRLGGADPSKDLLDPRELFGVLPKTEGRYQYPRDVQAEVWGSWFARRNERDLVLKMNTGAGKTVVGLLILKSCLSERKGPAVYITPDPYLTRQVVAEAEALGLTVTEDARSAPFRRGQAVLVANIYKLINGQSVFGVGEEGRKIPIGSMVVDDAHACLANTEDQFTLRLEAPSDAYEKVLGLFRDDLRSQSLTGVLEVEAQDPAKSMVVPFWAWAAKLDAITAILHPLRDSDELKWSWPLVKDVLRLCQCVIGGGIIEISLRCLPVDVIRSFADAERRVFMTATLAEDSILVTHFDVSPEAAGKPITPSRADDLGDRLILIPQELNPAIEEDDLRKFVKRLSKNHNVVVIVPSTKRAELWRELADQTLNAAALEEGIERLKKGHVGITVVLNKYDGIDLPDSACRILVLDGIPDVRSKLDRVEQGVLDGTLVQLAASIQRIEQGMGRGIRSNADYCVVLLMGRSLTQQLYSNEAIDLLTPSTRAQFDLSQEVAAQLRGKSLTQIAKAIDLVLSRDREWIAASRGRLAGVKYDTTGRVSPIALAQREAFDAARVGELGRAARVFQQAADHAPDRKTRGWLLQQMAEVTPDAVQAQVILRSAAGENRFVTKPMQGIDYKRLGALERKQGAAAAAFLQDSYRDANRFLVAVYGLLDAAKFEPETATAFERAFEGLAQHIGFAGQRPEAEYGKGPDVLWGLGSLQYLVVECKNGAVTDRISKSDVNQLAGSMNWFAESYDTTCKATPVMIHPVDIADRAATPGAQMRVMTTDKLAIFKGAMQAYAVALAGAGQWPPSGEAANDLLAHHGLTTGEWIQRYTVSMKKSR